MKLSAAVNLTIRNFAGGTITEYDSGLTNAIVTRRNDGRYQIERRPPINISIDASATVAKNKGRGSHYWESTGASYIVNDDTLYKNDYTNPIKTIDSGVKRVQFFEISTLLVLIDYENNKAWTISAADAVTEITDTNFPPNQTPALQLVPGGAVINGFLFVMTTGGIIQNSNLNDPTTWSALDYVEAEIDPDSGVFLTKHHQLLAAFGSKTVEYFVYDGSVVNGAPLARRDELAFSSGAADGYYNWQEGDNVYYIGATPSGALGIYTLNDFIPQHIVTPSSDLLDSLISMAIVKDGYDILMAGYTARGRTFLILTLYTLSSGVIIPETSLCFDTSNGNISFIETSIAGNNKFPLVSWTIRSGSSNRYGEGMFSNGDVISINDTPSSDDSLLADTYVDSGYVDTGYLTDGSASGTAITLKARLGIQDMDTDDYKFASNLTVNHDDTDTDQTITVRISRENSRSFNAGWDMSTQHKRRINRLGRFRRANFELEYSGSEAFPIEGIEFTAVRGAA